MTAETAPPLRHRNSFDALRLIAASGVIVGHAFPVTGRPSVYVAGVGLQALGVMVFFSISGFLITRSWTSDPQLGRFWEKRALRILPALVVVVLATALLVGPIVSTAAPGAYFRSAQTWRYLGQNLVLWTTHALPGVFASNPYPHSVNTSLWTLPIEVGLYASTLVLAPLLARFGRGGAALVALAAVASAVLWDRRPYSLQAFFDVQLYSFRVFDALGYTPNYLLGIVFASLRLDLTPPATGRRALLAALVALAALAIVPHRYALTLLLVPLTAATLYLGLGRTLSSPRLRRIGDISYGTYLWGFLVQQLVVWLIGTGGGPLLNAAVSLPIAWTIGFASWRLVEQPALRLKRQHRTTSRQAGWGPVESPALSTDHLRGSARDTRSIGAAGVDPSPNKLD